jgi:hypothetical protein
MTRAELEREVDRLRGRADFVSALAELGSRLPEDERVLLEEVLLVRGDYSYALRERVDEPWWYRLAPLVARRRAR